MRINKTLLGLTSTALLSILSVINVQAAVIYDNGTLPSTGGEGSDLDGTNIQANDFSLTAPNTTIRSINWRGFYGGGDLVPPASDAFTLRIYSDSSGPTGSLLHEFAVGNANRTDSGVNFAGRDIFTYSANITATTLSAGTNYWLSIFNNTSTDDDVWSWQYAVLPGAGNSVRSSNQGTSWFANATEHTFQLDDASVAPVPVPAAVWLMGSALMGLVGFRRKKSA